MESLPLSPENKGESIESKLQSLQLQYCALLWEKKIPLPFPNQENQPATFKDIVCQYGDIRGLIADAYIKRTGIPLYRDKAQLDAVLQEVVGNVEAEHQTNPLGWIAAAPRIIEESIAKFPEGKQEERPQEQTEEDSAEEIPQLEQAGLIHYACQRAEGPNLAKYGLSEGDAYIPIHIDPVFEQREMKQEGEAFSFSTSFSKSLQLLAKDMVSKYPDAKIVYMHSWLLDTAIAEKMGFHIVSTDEQLDSNMYFWGQFITKDGQINEERAKRFLETGKPPFQVKKGYIPKDEFLAKYLSSE